MEQTKLTFLSPELLLDFLTAAIECRASPASKSATAIGVEGFSGAPRAAPAGLVSFILVFL